MTDATVPADAHTEWCDPGECSAAGPGRHSSTTWTVGGYGPSGTDLTVTVRVAQHRTSAGPTGGDGPPFIEQTVHSPALDRTDVDDDYTIVLNPERALAVGHLLITAGQAATRQPVG